jgi:hypothetical protein
VDSKQELKRLLADKIEFRKKKRPRRKTNELVSILRKMKVLLVQSYLGRKEVPIFGVIFIIFLLLSSCISDAEAFFDSERASGIWAFDLSYVNTREFMTLPLERVAKRISADNPNVKGLAPRFYWRTIEPKEGKYNWEPIDRLFEIAEKYDKLIALRLIGGPSRKFSPDWIWKKFNRYFDTISHWGQNIRIPYLGEKKFQKFWNNFLVSVGKRYGEHPRLQRIHMSSGLDQEMYYIRGMSKKEFRRFCPEGTETFERDLLKSWHETFLTYLKAFPGKAFVLDLSMPVEGIEDIDGYLLMEKIVLDASKIFGSRLYLQQDGLSDRDPTAEEVIKRDRKSIRKLMLNLSEKHLLGFETLLPPELKKGMRFAPSGVFYEDLRKTIDIGLSYPIRYLELWTVTLNNPEYRDDVKYLKEHLDKRRFKR